MDFGRVGRESMVTATLYIEGGGEGRELGARFREGWNEFFKSAGVGNKTQIVRGGTRQQTFDRFATAVEVGRPDTVPILLVDSEAPVAARNSVWQHLHTRDSWSQPSDADDDQAFLMVQIMETWFLADRVALRRYFGARFRQNALKHCPDLERVPKSAVDDVLRRATASCSKRYSKGKVSFELLAQIDPSLVENECPHAKALLDWLRNL